MRIGRQRGKPGEAALAGKRHLAHDFLARQKTHQKHIPASQLRGGREGDDVDMRVARHRSDRLDLGGEQRPEDQLRALGDGRARRAGATALGGSVARDQRQLVAGGGEQRELRRFQHRLAELGIGA